ncbi:hypothetical protein Q2395_26055, partial [Escherichia coli]|nr:hypothetical protein [Escherichia coli]
MDGQDLITAMEEIVDVTAAVDVDVAAGPVEAADEKTESDVILKATAAIKVTVNKAVRGKAGAVSYTHL